MLKFRWETEFKETEIGEIPRDWKITNLGDNRFFKILPSGIKKFEGVKEYLSTSSVEGNEIVKIEEFITYNKRPSRANMQPVENSVWLARMINSPKFLKANKDLIENKILSTGFLGIQTKVKETCDYLFYYIQTKEFQEYKDAYVTGAVQESLTNENAKELLVIFPPLPEQSRIATVLSWFDDLIENKKRQNEILEKTAMAIFKSWFIDFEPFRDGEFVYSEELGREIPKGWEVDKTTRLINYNPSVSMEKGKIFPFVEMKDVSTNSLICDFSFKTFTGSGVKYFGGDTLMARITPSLEHGKTTFVWFISEKEKGFGSTEFFVLHPKEFYLKEFVYLLAKSNDFREVAINSMSGTSGRQRADINALKNYLIPIPPSPILQSFHSLVEPLFQKIILNQKQIMTLRKIRDTFLPLLVFGKLRIEEG
jgi:type I restriction enzyme S subunit